jgi:hypothetical protein
MTGRSQKAHRKEILHTLREDERRLVREGLPIPAPMMKALFDYIDGKLSSTECDHTLRYAKEFIQERQLPETKTLAWLKAAGGHCDCEALSNAEGTVEDAVRGYLELPPVDNIE